MTANLPGGVTDEVVAAFFALGLYSPHERSRPFRRIARGFVLCGLFPVVCLLAAIMDETLLLRGTNGGRGLFEHWGTLTQLASIPAILFLTYRIVRRLAEAIAAFTGTNHHEDDSGSAPHPADDTFVRSAMQLLTCTKPPCRVLLGLLMLTGFFSLIVNAQNTRHAERVYGQDVWDSSEHVCGYVAGRLFLGFEWIYIFPVVAYVAGAAFVVVSMLTKHIVTSERRAPSPFAPDGCGGFRVLGQVMLGFVFLDVPFACIVVAHVVTHDLFYLTLGLAGSLFGLAVGVQLFLPFLDLHRYLKTHKARMLSQLAGMIDGAQAALLAPDAPGATAPQLTMLALLGAYREARTLNTWPYLGTDVVKWASPLLPIVTAITSKMLLHALDVPP